MGSGVLRLFRSLPAPDLQPLLQPLVNHPTFRGMNLDLTDEEAAALLRELDGIIDGRTRCASLYHRRRSAMNHRGRPQRRDGAEDAEDKIHPDR